MLNLSVIQQECFDLMKKGEIAVLIKGCNVQVGFRIYPKAMIDKLCSMGYIKMMNLGKRPYWKYKKH